MEKNIFTNIGKSILDKSMRQNGILQEVKPTFLTMCTNEIMHETIASKASAKSLGSELILMMRKNYNINDELYVWKELKGREHQRECQKQ